MGILLPGFGRANHFDGGDPLMCKFLSVVVTRDGQIFHHPKESPIGNQSHTEIIEHHNLHDSPHRVNIARVEFTPPGDRAKIGDVSEWNLLLDEQREPDWWVTQKDSVQSRLKEYVDRHVYRAGCHQIQNSWAIGVGTAELVFQNSHATLWGSSHATLQENSQANLWENSQATLRGSSHATLRENSQANLWENSQATLWGNSQANLRGSSQATLWGSSQATLWDNSQANRRSNLGSGKVVVADRAVHIDWTTGIPTITTGWQTGSEVTR